jgi:predicted CoA-substrate-specific enzyme activase
VSAVAIGIDVGSTTLKAVAIDVQGAVLASVIEPTHPRIEQQSRHAVQTLKSRLGVDTVPIGATGYGRKRAAADTVLTEITCHARGAFHLLHEPGVLIDIGGQDTKVIRLGAQGAVLDFAMNDKCAAGTGRFLEVILGRLQVSLGDAAALSERASRLVQISSTCTVFAESEVVSWVAQGEPLEAILAGLHAALATRVAALAGRLVQGQPVFLSGGVALNRAMAQALAKGLGREVRVVPEPQLVGALGAALAAGATGQSASARLISR